MKRALFILLCVLSLSAFDSCSDKKKENLPADVIDLTVPLDFDESAPLPSISDLFEVREVLLETAGVESFVGMIEDIRQMGDTLFLKTPTSIMMFDADDGRFIRKIERVGRGRGEYVNISLFDLDEANNQIVIYTGNHEIMRYNTDGSFVSRAELSFNAIQFALLPNGNYVFFTPFDSYDPSGLWLTDGEFNIKRKLVSVDFHTNGYMGGKCLVHVNDSVVGFMGLDDTKLFYHIIGDSLIPVYRMVCDELGELEMIEMEYGGMYQPSFYRSQYYESDRLLAFNLQPSGGYTRMVRTFYDKKTGKTSYLYMQDPRENVDWADARVPYFTGNYKGYFYTVTTFGNIEYDEVLRNRYPEMTEESNPLIRIYRSK